MDWNAFILLALKIAAVAVLVALNGFFVAAEFALVKIRDTQLQPLINRGHRRARLARKVLANLDRSLSAAQLGITLASLGLGWVGEPFVARRLAPFLSDWGLTDQTAIHSISFSVALLAIMSRIGWVNIRIS